MSFQLSKDEITRRNRYVASLKEGVQAVELAIIAYNEKTAELKEPVETAVATYNETLQEVRGFAEDIASQFQTDIEDKSGRWQDGERGQAAQELQNEWEGLTLDDWEVTFPDELAFEEPTHADDLEGTSTELSE